MRLPSIRALLSICLLAATLLPVAAPAAGPVRVAVPPDVIADFNTLLAGRKPAQLGRYDGPGARRDVVELVLVQQALVLGGDPRPIELVPAPTYRRMLALVADGHADLTGTTVWATDIDSDAARLQASSALIADGEFTAGFFHARGAGTVRDRIHGHRWSGLSAVSSHTWTPDWQALQRLGLAHVYDASEWPVMVRMVAAGRADFLLAPFQPGTEPLIRMEGVVLEPVPGACVALAGSRHLALPRTASGDQLRRTLEQGLAQLRKRQAIHRAYTDSGFWNADARQCLLPH